MRHAHCSKNQAKKQISVSAIAKRIATELMTVNFGHPNENKCERIVLMKKTPTGERDLGGRCTQSVVEVIERHLKAAGL